MGTIQKALQAVAVKQKKNVTKRERIVADGVGRMKRLLGKTREAQVLLQIQQDVVCVPDRQDERIHSSKGIVLLPLDVVGLAFRVATTEFERDLVT